LLPYENGLVVAELTAADLREIQEEDGDQRTLWPAVVADGDARVRVAFNTYDAQSGGRRLPKLFEILSRPESKRRDTSVSAREALVDHLAAKGES
jgi:hypothetical protein